MYNIVVLYTELYLEYYFRLLYIIWKLYVKKNKIILFFIYSHDKFFDLLYIVESPKKILEVANGCFTKQLFETAPKTPSSHVGFLSHHLNVKDKDWEK